MARSARCSGGRRHLAAAPGRIEGRPRLLPGGLSLVLALLLLAGCDFSSPIATQVKRVAGDRARIRVTQTLLVHLEPRRVEGVTSRPGQVLRRSCSTTVIYAFNERVLTYLTQLHTTRLRSSPLPAGTRFAIRCDAALALELPASTARLAATARRAGRARSQALPVRSRLDSLPLAFGRRLVAERGMRLALIRWPSLAAGAYRLRLSFELPAGPIREKAILAASVDCGGSSYLVPTLPADVSLRGLRFLTVEHARSSSLAIPRSSQREGATDVQIRSLSCAR